MENLQIINFLRGAIDKTKNICKYLGVPVIKYSSPDSTTAFKVLKCSPEQKRYRYGFTLHIPPYDGHSEKSIIYYNDSESERVQAVTLAHELGHVLMEQWDAPIEERIKIGEMDKSEFFAEMFACIMMALNTQCV